MAKCIDCNENECIMYPKDDIWVYDTVCENCIENEYITHYIIWFSQNKFICPCCDKNILFCYIDKEWEYMCQECGVINLCLDCGNHMVLSRPKNVFICNFCDTFQGKLLSTN